MGSLFKNLKTTKLSGDFIYLKPGHYWARIDKVKQGETRKKEMFIAIELTIVSVFPTNESTPPHSIGEQVCHYIEVSGNEYAEKDFVGFVCGIMGCQPGDLDGNEDDVIMNEDPKKGPVQPFRGMVTEINARTVTTQKNTLFTKIRYQREVPAQELLNALPPEIVNRFFPDNFLGKQLAAQTSAPAA